MAKKKVMNPLEAHLEKIILVLVIGFLGWVVYARLINSPSIEVKGQSGKASDVVIKGVEIAQLTLEKIDRTDPSPPEPYQPQYQNFAKVPMLEPHPLDRVSFLPPLLWGTGSMEPQEIRNYTIPEMLALSDVRISLTHKMAFVPAESEDTEKRGRQDGFEPKDVDFVSVEAKFPLAEFRENFKRNFGGPKISVEHRLDNPDPILAEVELQRSMLMPDGSWGNWQRVSRLEQDDIHGQEIKDMDVANLTLTQLQVMHQTRRDLYFQHMVIKPQPYQLVDGMWMSHEEKEKQKELEKEQASPRGDMTALMQPRGRRGGGMGGMGGGMGGPMGGGGAMGGRRGGRGRGAGGMGGMGGGMGGPMGGGLGGPMGGGLGGPMGGGMGGPMGGGMGGPMGGMGGPMGGGMGDPMGGGMGMMGGPGGGISRARRSQGSMSYDEEWFDQEMVTVWSHDAQVESGKVYRYRIRLGIFNPAAGRPNWLIAEQKTEAEKVLFWTDWIQPENIVKVPERTIFFPKPIPGKGGVQSLWVEVARRQNGQWHLEKFRISPGSKIGAPKDVVAVTRFRGRRATLDEISDNTEEIDYSTDITVLDVVPNSRHWYRMGSALRDTVTTDIVYLKPDGTVERIGVDKRVWPEHLVKLYSSIKKDIREKSKG